MIRIQKKRTLFFAGLLLFATVGFRTQPEAEEYEVYRFLLADRSSSVISSVTSHSRVTKEHRKMLIGGEADLFSSYKWKNSMGFHLQSNKFDGLNITLLSREEVKLFFQSADHNELKAEEDFNKKFGSREIIYLSRVGFNKTSTRALINVTYAGICGTCSESYFLLLEKSAGKWLVLRKTVAWMS